MNEEIKSDKKECVNMMNTNVGDEEESEEFYLHINFEELLNDCTEEELRNAEIIGIDIEEPILKIGHKFFSGEWKQQVGTPLFFEGATPVPRRCYFSVDVTHPLKYTAKANRSMGMKRVFVCPKKIFNETNNNSKENISGEEIAEEAEM